MIARTGLGTLLLAAAVLKLTGGSGEVARIVLPYISTRLYMAGIVFEAILGAWLLSGLAPATVRV